MTNFKTHNLPPSHQGTIYFFPIGNLYSVLKFLNDFEPLWQKKYSIADNIYPRIKSSIFALQFSINPCSVKKS
jgi:hypothetical protein